MERIYFRSGNISQAFGRIVVIKRDGADGKSFPLTVSSCVFGRGDGCDIRIQQPNVSKEHCRLDLDDGGQV